MLGTEPGHLHAKQTVHRVFSPGPEISHLFILVLGPILSNAKGFVLGFYSGLTPGGAQRIMWYKN